MKTRYTTKAQKVLNTTGSKLLIVRIPPAYSFPALKEVEMRAEFLHHHN